MLKDLIFLALRSSSSLRFALSLIMIREIYLGNLVSNLINSTRYDFQQLQAFWGFGDEFKQLHQKLSAIADLVKGLEARHERSDEIRMKLREIDEVAYEADDLLSELAYETTRLQIQPKKVCVARIYSFCTEKLRRNCSISELNFIISGIMDE
ncbi:hypothetical protein M5689_002257 [Euphorbia peplus]|nr:hypothetical protein M5689_002257 [Euphorbia peplus]